MLQKAMEMEKDRAAKAKLQKDSQQAKYEQQVEENMKKEKQCKQLMDQLEVNKQVLDSVTEEINIVKKSMLEYLNEEQREIMQNSIREIEKKMATASKVRENYSSETKRRHSVQSARISIPLPQVPQFAARNSRSYDHGRKRDSIQSSIFDDMRKKSESVSKQLNIHENV